MSTSLNKKPKIALVHDFLTYFGGAERVLMSLHKLYPESPIYILLYDEKKMKQYFPNAKIKPSFLNKLPKFLRERKKYLLPLMPTAAETFDLRDFDVVISSSSSFAKGIITKPKTIHICYCHAPTRFLWDWHYNYLAENGIKGIKKVLLLPFLHYLRMWDKSASERVDQFIANSKNTAQKIKKFYGRDSVVIYPPVEKLKIYKAHKVHKVESQLDNKFQIPNSLPEADQPWAGKFQIQDNYFLIVSRLSPYKKIDIAVEAFNKLGFPLVVIGDGEDRKKLEKMAEKNILFLGFQPEEKIAKYYQNCYAFVFPGEDDFGITIVEAMSFGKPVLAFRKGGATEIMTEGVTGEFFDDPIPEILADGVRRMKNSYNNYNSEKIAQRAKKFSEKNFEESIKNIIEKLSRD